MLVSKTVQLTVLAAAVLWGSQAETAALVSKLCGRQLSETMSRICDAYNSPPWDVPTVVEQSAAVVRRRRQTGIADECCTYGCTAEMLKQYCAISTNFESLLDSMDSHMIEDRSAELGRTGIAKGIGPGHAPAAVGSDQYAGPREVGRARSRGYGRAGWRRRCRCRGRRSRRRRPTLMGNMDIKSAARAAPVVGTVSPLLTWGRTLNTDLPTVDNDRSVRRFRTTTHGTQADITCPCCTLLINKLDSGSHQPALGQRGGQ